MSFLSLMAYQYNFSTRRDTDAEISDNYSRIVKTNGQELQIYQDKQWETLVVKGVELSAFQPGYGRFETGISKKDVLKWLEEIDELHANVIKVPYIQSPNFYAAIYDYNLNKENPLYVIHEIMLDERAALKNYDAFEETIYKNLKKDIKNTIDVINGQAFLFNNKRNHSGIYLRDISKYNLGFIIGTNINPEIVALTNEKYQQLDSYEGKHFTVTKGNAFEVFVGEMLDFANEYEIDNYQRSSLFSFLSSVETDAIAYQHESNLTKYADFDIEAIVPKEKDNLFISYKYHPSSADFLEYEYKDGSDSQGNDSLSVISQHLERLVHLYNHPIIISDTGISSSRAKSNVDLVDGFDRGGFSEKEQGERLVRLLDQIYQANIAGAIVSTWQDDWTKLTSLSPIKDYLDENNASYWQDRQSSDESFGLLKFEAGKKEEKIYINGEFSDWELVPYVLEEGDIKLKVKSDLTNMYVLIEKEGWSLNEDRLYLGINVTPLSGSKNWKDEANFNTEADFIVKLAGYNESRIVVNERYNLFSYLYKYYDNIIEKQTEIPVKDTSRFESIYLLNRKNFYLKDSNQVEPPIYYETGKLVYGDDHPESDAFHSNADFNKEGDKVELKIPWSLINVVDPLNQKAYGDFYLEGPDAQVSMKTMGFSVNYQGHEQTVVTEEANYVMDKLEPTLYYERLKDSYYILKNYWQGRSE